MVNCQHCGKKFKTTPYRISIGSGKYCSPECVAAANVKLDEDKRKKFKPSKNKPNWFTVKCENCGIEFDVPPYRIQRGKSLYHNASCRASAENRKRAAKKKLQNAP